MRCSALLIVLGILAAGCSRKAEGPSFVRLAIPPAENLSGRVDLDWVGFAVAQVAASSLMGARGVHPAPVRSPRDAAVSGASSALFIRYEARDGKLEFRVDVRGVGSQKTEKSFTVQVPVDGGALRAGEEIAKKLAPEARGFGTRNERALRDYVAALQAGSITEMAAAFQRAVAADPGFGEAWVAWVQVLAESGRREEALAALERAKQSSRQIGEIERARLAWLGATLAGDSKEQVRALTEIATLLPGDVVALAAAARAEQSAGRYSEAAAWFRKAALVDPRPAQWWNQALYAHAYAGDWPGVQSAFAAYRKAAPDDPNALDSLGEAALHLGRIVEADNAFSEAYRLNAGFLQGLTLYKAALALRMAGNGEKAEERFRQFLEKRRQDQDPLAGYWEARWICLTVGEDAAITALEKWSAQAAAGDVKALGLAQTAIWQLAKGRAREALETSRLSMSEARSPAAKAAAAAAVFVSGPQTAGRVPDSWLAYRLLLRGRFAEAVPILERMRSRGTPGETGSATALLAWSYLETGRTEEAKRAAGRFPIPAAAAEDIFEFLPFSRLPAVRKALGL